MLRQRVQNEVLVRRYGVRARLSVQLGSEEAGNMPPQEIPITLQANRVRLEGPGLWSYFVPAHVLAQLGRHLTVDREAVEILFPMPHKYGEPFRRKLAQVRRRVVRHLFLGDGQRYVYSRLTQDLVRPHVARHDHPIRVVGLSVRNDLDTRTVRAHGPDGGVLQNIRASGAGQGDVYSVGLPGVHKTGLRLIDRALGAGEAELRPAIHYL